MKVIINQINVIDYQISENSATILDAIDSHKDCKGVLLFPELALTGFPTKENVDALYQDATTSFEKILVASKHTEATLIIGHIEKAQSSFYNTCFFIKNGTIIHKHRKSKLWLDDVGIFTKGSQFSVVEVNDVVCGAQICFELEFPEGSRALSTLGAKIIFMPNGNMHPYANVHYVLTQARAIENQCFVITCNRVGMGHGGHFVGESLVVSPTGDIIKKLGSAQETVAVDIDVDQVDIARKDYEYIELI